MAESAVGCYCWVEMRVRRGRVLFQVFEARCFTDGRPALDGLAGLRFGAIGQLLEIHERSSIVRSLFTVKGSRKCSDCPSKEQRREDLVTKLGSNRATIIKIRGTKLAANLRRDAPMRYFSDAGSAGDQMQKWPR